MLDRGIDRHADLRIDVHKIAAGDSGIGECVIGKAFAAADGLAQRSLIRDRLPRQRRRSHGQSTRLRLLLKRVAKRQQARLTEGRPQERD